MDSVKTRQIMYFNTYWVESTGDSRIVVVKLVKEVSSRDRIGKNVFSEDKVFWMISKAFFLQKHSRYPDRRGFLPFIVNDFFPFGSKFLDIILLNIFFFNDLNQKYKDSLQMYSEFLLTLRFDVHVASIISGLEI